MTPNSWFTLFTLLFLFLPGVYADYLSLFHKSPRVESRLQEFGRIILSSFVFSLISILTFVLINSSPNIQFFNFNKFSLNPAGYFQKNVAATLLTVLLLVLFSLFLAWLVDFVKIALTTPNFTGSTQWEVLFRNRQAKSKSAPAWIQRLFDKSRNFLGRIFKSIPRKLDSSITLPVALVSLNDGSNVVGYVDLFSPEEPLANREITLSQVQPTFVDNLPDAFKEAYKTQNRWSRFYAPISSINSIEVVYFEFM